MDDREMRAQHAAITSQINAQPDHGRRSTPQGYVSGAAPMGMNRHYHKVSGPYRWAASAVIAMPFLVASALGADGGADGNATSEIQPWPGYWSHLVALVLIALSFTTTAALNAARADTRIIGTLLGALGCFGVLGFYLWALCEGVITNPRPIYKPTDHLKPMLFSVIAAAAAAAGMFLLVVARWQKKAARDQAPLGTDPTEGYSKTSRYLHWMIATLFLMMIPIGIFMSMIPSGTAYRYTFYGLHKTIGVTILILVLLRILWNFRSKRPPLEASLSGWERRLASSAHLVLYIIMLGFPLSGYIMSTFAGHPTGFFLWKLPMLLPENDNAAIPFGIAHTIVLPYLFFIVFGAHILGGLKHRFLDGQKSFYRRIVS